MNDSLESDFSLSFYEVQMLRRAGLNVIRCDELVRRALENSWFMTKCERSSLEQVQRVVHRRTIDNIDEGSFRRIVSQTSIELRRISRLVHPRRLD